MKNEFSDMNIKKLENEKNELNEKKLKFIEEKQKLKEELTEKEEEKTNLNNKIEKIKNELEENNNQLQYLKDIEILSPINNYIKQNIEELKEKKRQLEKQIEEYKLKLKDIENSIFTYYQKLQTINNNIEKIEKNITKIEKKLNLITPFFDNLTNIIVKKFYDLLKENIDNVDYKEIIYKLTKENILDEYINDVIEKIDAKNLELLRKYFIYKIYKGEDYYVFMPEANEIIHEIEELSKKINNLSDIVKEILKNKLLLLLENTIERKLFSIEEEENNLNLYNLFLEIKKREYINVFVKIFDFDEEKVAKYKKEVRDLFREYSKAEATEKVVQKLEDIVVDSMIVFKNLDETMVDDPYIELDNGIWDFSDYFLTEKELKILERKEYDFSGGYILKEREARRKNTFVNKFLTLANSRPEYKTLIINNYVKNDKEKFLQLLNYITKSKQLKNKIQEELKNNKNAELIDKISKFQNNNNIDYDVVLKLLKQMNLISNKTIKEILKIVENSEYIDNTSKASM